MEENRFYRLLSFVRLSPHRQKIIHCLYRSQQAMTPTDIAEAIDVHRNHISNHLSKMMEKGLVEVLNPESSRHRYYKLTDTGTSLFEKASKLDVDLDWHSDAQDAASS